MMMKGISKRILLYAGAGFTCTVLAVWMFILYFNNPIHQVRAYIDAVEGSQWDSVYEMLEMDEYGQFLSKSSYLSIMEEQYRDIQSYSIKKLRKDVYEITYRTNTEEEKTTVKVTGRKEKDFLVFNNYGISPIDLLIENVSLVVPRDINVSLNGVLLNYDYRVYESEVHTEDFENVYLIPQLCKGSYVIELSGDNYQTVTEEVDIINNDQVIKPQLPYLNEKVLEKVSLLCEEKIREQFDEVLEKNNEEDCYQDIELTNISVSIIDYGYENSGLYIETEVCYHVSATRIQKITDTYTDISYYKSGIESFDDSCNFTFTEF